MISMLKRATHELMARQLLGPAAIAIGISSTSFVAGAETAVEKKKEPAGVHATSSALPDANATESEAGTSTADCFDPAADIAAIQSRIEATRRDVERQMAKLPVMRFPFPDHFEIPLLPTDQPRFVTPPIPQMWIPVFPQPPQGSTTYRRAWQQRSASSWSQQGSRFCYEQPVRGVVVRLAGHLAGDSLAIEQIEVAPGDSKSAKVFGALSDVPEAYQDEVEAACNAARQYVEKRAQ